MTRAEEQALKAYPIKIAAREGYDENLRERKGFIKGYNRAEKDLMEKAKQWFTEYIPSQKLQLWWCDFELFIAEN